MADANMTGFQMTPWGTPMPADVGMPEFAQFLTQNPQQLQASPVADSGQFMTLPVRQVAKVGGTGGLEQVVAQAQNAPALTQPVQEKKPIPAFTPEQMKMLAEMAGGQTQRAAVPGSHMGSAGGTRGTVGAMAQLQPAAVGPRPSLGSIIYGRGK